MTMLSSSSPVAATSRSGGRLMPARSSTKSSVASPRITWCSNSASSLSNRYGRCSISVTSCPARSSERVRFAPTLPPPAIRTYIRRVASSASRTALDERLDRGRRRADDAQAARRVELRARRVEHADDHRRHLEVLLGRLRDHEVRVVAVGRDDDGVGLLDPGLAQERGGPCRGRRGSRRSSCSPSRPSASSFSSSTVTSQPEAVQLQRDGRADPATSDHDRLHSGAAYSARRVAALRGSVPGICTPELHRSVA